MSRIGKLPIVIPSDVEINYNNSNLVVKGKFGSLQLNIPNNIEIEKNNSNLKVHLKNNKQKALHGLYRTLISNMILGVSKQFELTLVLKGVGYRAVVQENNLILNLGYSHPVKIIIPDTIFIEVVQNTTINLKSCDKQLLGLFAANVRAWRQPEPYKGKGILYKNEKVVRKAGKSGK